MSRLIEYPMKKNRLNPQEQPRALRNLRIHIHPLFKIKKAEPLIKDSLIFVRCADKPPVATYF